ncbi:2,3-bisphosphoglycerate-independent phosphoglycerate mutase [Aliikangiella coralliicola]|uniref:2,3-bisphosphoglycerate-independent phosphoglycerate mutase n=1 Tax=Aliikangiella coralliicola TaxID=2592383 RepID=A0A545UHB0_9GAMM|nr:2,3-bisphosphoglycerate-independent phosphoglycerate mutase [Aliikangiella coralliicola]TQV88861.1 2,3-bisphosphoglycerate-independent phosphoglycerate mutase [Aliikangiella coralliicola]
MQRRPIALIIMDGWGHSESPESNAIMAADKPVFDDLWKNCPRTLISGSGEDVGLPDQQMGNSEVGHLNLGAGRVVYQDFTRITKAIKDGEFQQNPTIVSAIEKAVSAGKAVHLMGLLSDGGVHSHIDHIKATCQLAADLGAEKIYLHAFLDGRDTPPQSAAQYIESIESLSVGRIASLTGRYYAMDRDQRWERVELAYRMLVSGHSDYTAETALEGLQNSYDREEFDEFVKPTVIGEPAPIESGDAVLFLNYRADRAREITRAFVDQDFTGFERTRLDINYVMLTQYAADIQAPCAYGPLHLPKVLGEHLQDLGKKQLRIAETEKYAHVTFFFNGGVETPFEGEDRELIPSPQVATYDLQPEMNAPLLTDKFVAAIESGQYDFIICNFANPDMVGHTGNFDATVKAITCLDKCLGRIIDALKTAGGEAFITADHGNAEKMCDHETGQPHTAHTNFLVPFIYVGRNAEPTKENGVLSDVAPTLLAAAGLPIPDEMTGTPLMNIAD